MAPSLHTLDNGKRIEAIKRRLVSQTRGLGYWAAIDAMSYLEVRMFVNIGKLPDETKIHIMSQQLRD